MSVGIQNLKMSERIGRGKGVGVPRGKDEAKNLSGNTGGVAGVEARTKDGAGVVVRAVTRGNDGVAGTETVPHEMTERGTVIASVKEEIEDEEVDLEKLYE